ncbi:L-aspartate oxidase [Legionella israelensis]|uniref:L-aspartate oxidase n=1 Tax=Legionella israelensis TaxID=454 RepID=UPI00117E9720|nr:L-aspartate oxidase [Legionella israelensis]QDP72443.1 L-aspartate oxidase [Legionella israelensis]
MSMPSTQQGKHYEFDVLVIGTGLAGLYYCLQLLNFQPKLRIALISKAESNECNSRYAQGGIAAVFSPEDSVESHIADTLLAGDGLCYRPAVEFIVRQGPEAIEQLCHYHIQFNQQKGGDYILAREGGHSHRRIFNCGDQTGLTVIRNLQQIASQYPQIELFEYHIAINLITHYHPHRTDNQGEVLGAYILDCKGNKIHTFLSRCTVLATGGAGKTFRYTSNPMVATGDGVAMAYRAGARVGNMEFYQFHPTLLHHHSLNNFLVSEAVRGEGALLINPDSGERFMQRYAPERLELATRDIVARSIFNEVERSQTGYVYLDIRHKPKSFLKKRFPHIFNTLLSIGIDMSQDMIPVIPAAHYQCGGILTDIDGRTDLQRLYAIGEVAFTGLHGANRLASNSLLEALVMANNAARCTLKDISSPSKVSDNVPGWNSPGEVNARRASQINAHWRGLRGEMTSYAGIIRTEAGLEDLLQLIMKRKKIIEEYYWKHSITLDFVELRNIVLNAELIVRAALSRRESRGGHYREDFPQKNTEAQESIARLTSPLNSFI